MAKSYDANKYPMYTTTIPITKQMIEDAIIPAHYTCLENASINSMAKLKDNYAGDVVFFKAGEDLKVGEPVYLSYHKVFKSGSYTEQYLSISITHLDIINPSNLSRQVLEDSYVDLQVLLVAMQEKHDMEIAIKEKALGIAYTTGANWKTKYHEALTLADKRVADSAVIYKMAADKQDTIASVLREVIDKLIARR